MRVYLISCPSIYHNEYAKFLAAEGLDKELCQPNVSQILDNDSEEGEIIPEIAGRLCYMSFNTPRPGGTEAYLKHILEVGHGSVLEHSNYGFIITGISRSCSHELVRHRHFSYSQLSQRYVSSPSCVRNPAWQDDEWEALTEDLITLLHQYEGWITEIDNRLPVDLKGTERKKAARQLARAILPSCTETKLMMTGNVRAWRGMIEQRGSKHAEPEIRQLAYLLWKELHDVCPLLFDDFKWVLGEGQSDAGVPIDLEVRYKKV